MGAVSYKHGLPKPDKHGCYRPYIGWKVGDDGQRRQHRFNLGSDRRAAQARYDRIHALWLDDVRTNGLWQGGPQWSPQGLAYAVQLAKGAASIPLSPPEPFPPDFPFPNDPAYYQREIHLERQRFPSADFVATDPAALDRSVRANREYVVQRIAELQAELKSMGALLDEYNLPAKSSTATLHEAIDAYIVEYRNNAPKLDDGKSDRPNTKKEVERLNRIKLQAGNFPLHELNKERCESMIAHWRNRPTTRKGTTAKRSTGEHHIKQLIRLFKWLDLSAKFEWSMPKGVLSVKRSVATLPTDRTKKALAKLVYSPEQLGKLNETATDWQRLAFYLALNCGMGAAELGRLTIEDFDRAITESC